MRLSKRSFGFYSEMQNFENCAQTSIRFFTMKHKILKTATKRPFMFLQRNTEFWKLYPNGHSYFPQRNTKSDYFINNQFSFVS